jgi:hypothetical protein
MNELIGFLSSLTLNPSLAKIKTIEADLKGSLNPTVWLHQTFFEQNKWLNFNAFYQYYLQNNEHILREMFPTTDWNDLKKGLEARLYRTQFGMLTEYHAYFLAKDFLGEQYVSRDSEIDRIGVDFQLNLNGQFYNIHIFVDTDRAWAYRKFKIQYKQSNKMNGLHVNLPYSLARHRFNSLAFLPNGFGIYQQSYLEYLKNEVLLGNIKNDNIGGTTSVGFIYTY